MCVLIYVPVFNYLCSSLYIPKCKLMHGVCGCVLIYVHVFNYLCDYVCVSVCMG